MSKKFCWFYQYLFISKITPLFNLYFSRIQYQNFIAGNFKADYHFNSEKILNNNYNLILDIFILFLFFLIDTIYYILFYLNRFALKIDHYIYKNIIFDYFVIKIYIGVFNSFFVIIIYNIFIIYYYYKYWFDFCDCSTKKNIYFLIF